MSFSDVSGDAASHDGSCESGECAQPQDDQFSVLNGYHSWASAISCAINTAAHEIAHGDVFESVGIGCVFRDTHSPSCHKSHHHRAHDVFFLHAPVFFAFSHTIEIGHTHGEAHVEHILSWSRCDIAFFHESEILASGVPHH